MIVLSFSGGIIFLLPFLQEVYYIPIREALGLDNTEVGSLMSVFGVTAMLSYFPGGWLADRVSPRKLITVSLFLTGSAGLYFSTFPSYEISLLIHAFWGISITFLFWAAMIRVTRNWAPSDEQGKAWMRGLARRQGVTEKANNGIVVFDRFSRALLLHLSKLRDQPPHPRILGH